MRTGPSLYVAIRTLWIRKKGRKGLGRLLGAVIGIALSLVPLIVVVEVTNGMIEGITRRYVEIGSYHLQIRNYTGVPGEEVKRAASDISRLDSVTLAFPSIDGIALGRGPSGTVGVFVRGIPEDHYQVDTGFRKYLEIKSGSFSLEQSNDVVISSLLAEKLGLVTGGNIVIITSRELPGGRYIMRPTILNIRGICSSGYQELDGTTMYINIDKAFRLFGDAGHSLIGVKVEDPYSDISRIKKMIQGTLKPGWFVISWHDLERGMYESFRTTKNLLTFIMILILLVASVNISSALVMIILEKKQEIAILKSVGGGPGFIMKIYMIIGFITGTIGTIFGIAIGMFTAVHVNELISGIEWLINLGYQLVNIIISGSLPEGGIKLLSSAHYLDTIPIRIGFREISLIGFFAIFLSVLASYLPARQAGKMKPIEIMRKH